MRCLLGLSNREILSPQRVVMRTCSKLCLLGLIGGAAWLLLAQSPLPPSDRPSSSARTEIGVWSKSSDKDSRARTTNPLVGTIGHLGTRDRLITVTAGRKELRYTIRDKNGRLLHANLTAQELQAKAPVLHELVTGGYAGGPPKLAVTFDASVRPPVSADPKGR